MSSRADIWKGMSIRAKDAIETMSGGDLAVIGLCVEIVSNAPLVDPECMTRPLGVLSPLFCLDMLGIHDAKILLFYRDVCRKHVGYMMALLRGSLLGLISESRLRYAIEHHGEGVDLDMIIRAVCARLPSFDPENIIVCA